MRVLGALLLSLLAASSVFAQGGDPPIQGPPPPELPEMIARDAQGRITMRAMRTPSPMVFDGVLDEPFYRDVKPVGDFIQQEPTEGAPATEKTEVWVFFDRDNLYVSARMYDSQPDKRVATEMRRDANNLFNNDHFGVSFDGFYDRRNGYGFVVNVSGALLDWSTTNEQPNNSWNGVWDAKTSTFSDGWSVEIRFPFRSFRYREGGTIWGMNFRRRVIYKNELSYLAPVLASWGRPAMSRMSAAATVVGIQTPPIGKNIDVKPYALGSLLTDRTARPPVSNEGDGNLGVDVKWGIKQTLVADLTINTDFAQVEDDQQVVNLSRFSVLFPEKRDFFLEGADTFNFANGSAGTGGTGGGGGQAGSSQNTSTAPLIFYSRRIGLNNGLEVPIRAGGRLLGRSGLWRYGVLNIQTAASQDANSPSTNFSVVRVNRDIFQRSRVGAIFTRRDPVATTRYGAQGSENLAYGLDTLLSPTKDTSINAYLARTDSPGRTGDDTSYRGRFDWNADKYGLSAEHLSVGADFNPEVGFLRRTAFRRSYGQARYSPRPRKFFGVRKLYYIASIDYITDTQNRPESKEVQGNFQFELNNSDTFSFDVSRNYERLVNRFEVGKKLFVPAGEYEMTQSHATYTFGQQRPLSGSLTAARSGFYGGTLTELTWSGRVELSRQFYLEPQLSWNKVDVPQGKANSNLYSSRATYTLSTRMFVSALIQYQSRTDSVTTNARFRWEYLPGSELFVVYSDGRTTVDAFGRSVGFPELQNRSFIVKVTRLLRW
ncbi:MAG: carbohydrate binding family 9 domain-containing protein [Acidobacteria bacterium]|nr:carbohydrate binding family 9 domain-containing protein [Acidobacteriota bacterium]